ncbi:MAG: hypothetical protein CVV22_06670 [Ignavibacteriae bacterium HGW-Ignavibacteriae-1]|jgi:hypothetical protein|nr:MAG: hypothetical protein CVV22_06670 [Ignavibacteriae bacterium HGW-Ignavibacteriae-1]
MELYYKSLEKFEDHWVLHCDIHLDEVLHLSFIIDNQTAREFRQIFCKKPFGENYQHIYNYAGFSIAKENREYYHYINIYFGKSRLKEKLKCSERFIKELMWLMETNDMSKLDVYRTKHS